MTEVALILACAAVGFGVARLVKVPAVPVLLIAGFALGESGLLGEPDVRYDLLAMGVGFLLFFVGTELNPQRIKHYRRAALRIGFIQFLALGGIGLAVALLFGRDLATSAYVGLAVAASSTLIVIRLLQQRRQMFEPFGRTVIGVLLLQDTLVVLLLPFLYKADAGIVAALVAVAITVAMAGVAYVMLRWIVPWLVSRLYDDDEILLLVVLAILFLFIGAAYLFDVPLVSGAFIAGVALSSFPASGFVRLQFNPLSDFFTSVFLVVLGTLASVSIGWQLLEALAYAGVVLVVTPVLVTFVAERSGLSTRASIESGLLLAQTSELSLVIVLNAFLAGTIGQDMLSVIVLTTVLTMVLTPLISTDRFTWALMRWHPAPQRHGSTEFATEDHIVLLGVGRHGIPLLETLLFAGYDIVVVDDDVALVTDLLENDVPCLRGDASDPTVLERVGADRAKVIISLIRRPKDNLKVLAVAGDTPVIVRVFEDEDEEIIREAGGVPVSFAEAAAEGFLVWFSQWTGMAVPVKQEVTSAAGNEQPGGVADISKKK